MDRNRWDAGFRDGFDKIYKFNAFPLIIFNHGQNQFQGRYWDQYCLDYEQSDKWQGKELKTIAENFESFIEDKVKKQLTINKQCYPDDKAARCSGFVICGKNMQQNRYEIYEHFWNPEKAYPKRYPWFGIRLNGFGIGYEKYLGDDKHLAKFNDQSTYIKANIKNNLIELFILARKKKKDCKGVEFSDDLIIKSVMQDEICKYE